MFGVFIGYAISFFGITKNSQKGKETGGGGEQAVLRTLR